MKKTIIITGVGKGFGRELLDHFFDKYRVIGITRSRKDIDQIKNDYLSHRPDFELLELDVTNELDLNKKLVPKLNQYSKSIYGLINNAGIRYRKAVKDLEIDEYKRVCEVNLFAPINLTNLILPYMVANGSGRVINISSILSTNSLPELSAYTVSKAGLDGFTRSIAVEYGNTGITCNSILPGFCKTSYFENFSKNKSLYNMTLEKTPANKWGEASEINGLCELLLADQGNFINGSSIPIDGGWSAV